MAEVKSFMVSVNTRPDRPYNHYASYVVAFLAKKLAGIEKVAVYYGPEGIAMTKKGELAKLAITDEIKNLIAGQVDGLNASDLPDNLEQLARFLKSEMGVEIYSCGTFHVIDKAGADIGDTSGIEDFIVPLKLPQAAEALLSFDKIHYL